MPAAIRVIDSHSELVGVTADQHHARSHDHSVAGDNTALTPASLAVTGGPFRLGGDISPAQIVANENDYAPAGLAEASVLRLSSDASRNITGLTGGADGRLLLLVNIGAFDLVLVDESGLSVAGNRFALSASFTLTPDTGAVLLYDSTTARWRLVAMGVAGGEQAIYTGNKTITGSLTVTAGPITLSAGQLLIPNGVVATPPLALSATPGTGWYARSGSDWTWASANVPLFTIATSLIGLHASISLSWRTPDVAGTTDLSLFRDAADTLAQRRTTNPQTLRLYGTYTDASNYERLRIGAQAANDLLIVSEAGGTGAVRNIKIDPGTADIKWGKALVALGGGIPATPGAIGGSGPATAAQNSWMRVLDSTGAAFWVPAWK